MITELKPEQLIEFGVRYRADYLDEQAGYTLGVAVKDGTPLTALLSENYLDEVRGEKPR